MAAWQTLPATLVLAVNAVLTPAPPPPSPAALSPAAAQTEEKLKEIGHVQVTNDICKPLLRNAGLAVDSMLDNNLKLGQTIARMRTLDLDSSNLARVNGAHDLMARFVQMRRSAVDGKAAVAAFREEAKTVTDEQQKENLLAFANALDGALERQRKLAYDVSRLAVYVDVHPPIDEFQLEQEQIDLQAQQSYRYSPPGTDGFPYNIPRTLSQISTEGADILLERAQPMFNDEKDAATRLEPAFSAC